MSVNEAEGSNVFPDESLVGAKLGSLNMQPHPQMPRYTDHEKEICLEDMFEGVQFPK